MNQALSVPHLETARIERLLPGPIERVWDYLTKPGLQRTWLAGAEAELGDVTRCQPLRSIEYSLPDSSVLSMELEPRGKDVKLVLTHRRLPAWLAGAATALLVAVLTFSFFRSDASVGLPQGSRFDGLGPQITQSSPSLNSLHLKRGRFTLC